MSAPDLISAPRAVRLHRHALESILGFSSLGGPPQLRSLSLEINVWHDLTLTQLDELRAPYFAGLDTLFLPLLCEESAAIAASATLEDIRAT